MATPIMPESFAQSTGTQFKSMGVDFATAEDAISATARLVTDTTINGESQRVRGWCFKTINFGLRISM